MQAASITNYTTRNRIGAKETQFSYQGYGATQALEVLKSEIGIEDLFSGDTFYSKRMKLEYKTWNQLHPHKRNISK